jgi:flavin reductase (DIM6/NTAB) family NADH-FMN oxidoreductase RutF
VQQVFDFSTMSAVDRYKLLCGVVVPRPIALVASIDAAGKINAAPLRSLTCSRKDPPQIVRGLQHRQNRKSQRAISPAPANL